MPGGLPRVQLQHCLPSFFSFKFRVSNFKFQVDISFCLLPSAFCLLPIAYCSASRLSTCPPPASLPAAQTHMLPRLTPASPGNFPLVAVKPCAIPAPANARGLLRRVCHSAWTRQDKSPVLRDRNPVSTRPQTTT